MLAFISKFCEIWGSTDLIKIIEKKEIFKILKNDKIIGYCEIFLGGSPYVSKIVGLFSLLKKIDSEWSLKLLKNWDLSRIDFVDQLPQYIADLDSAGIKVQYTRYSNITYLFNLVSKEVTKLKIDNFKLPNQNLLLLKRGYDGIFDSYRIETVQDYKSLLSIGATLHNCAGNFEQIEYYKESISLAFIKDEKVVYLLSIQDGCIHQFKGFKNSKPSFDLFEKIYHFLIEKRVCNPHILGTKECYRYVC